MRELRQLNLSKKKCLNKEKFKDRFLLEGSKGGGQNSGLRVSIKEQATKGIDNACQMVKENTIQKIFPVQLRNLEKYLEMEEI